jgi:hypothetical protein
VPAGDPERSVAVAPDAPRALARHRRLQDRDSAGLEIDLAEIVAGEYDLIMRNGTIVDGTQRLLIGG